MDGQDAGNKEEEGRKGRREEGRKLNFYRSSGARFILEPWEALTPSGVLFFAAGAVLSWPAGLCRRSNNRFKTDNGGFQPRVRGERAGFLRAGRLGSTMPTLPNTIRQAISTNLLTLTKFRDLLKKIKKNRPSEDLTVLRRAYRFSAHHHMPQVRASGGPYLSHPLEVAHILADMRMDVPTIATALLHDIVEDTSVTPDELRENFGEEIAHLVEGVTKISRLDFTTKEQRQADNVRKMLLAMVDD